MLLYVIACDSVCLRMFVCGMGGAVNKPMHDCSASNEVDRILGETKEIFKLWVERKTTLRLQLKIPCHFAGMPYQGSRKVHT